MAVGWHRETGILSSQMVVGTHEWDWKYKISVKTSELSAVPLAGVGHLAR